MRCSASRAPRLQLFALAAAAVLLCAGASLSAPDERDYPLNIVCSGEARLKLTRVRITKQATFITLVWQNKPGDTVPLTVAPPGHREAYFIKSTTGKERWDLLDATGIAIKPEYTKSPPGGRIEFVLKFERIPDSMPKFHLIEGDVQPVDGNTTWHFLNVPLK
jgi:hypothetical protein